MEPLKTHDAICDAVDSATAGTSPSPELSANMLGEYEAVDSATAGTSSSPEVSANMLGEYEATDSATAGTSPSPEVSANTLGECEAVDSASVQTFSSPNAAIASTSANISSSQYEKPVIFLSRLEAYNAFVTKSRNLYQNGRPTDLNRSEKIDVVMTLFGDKLKPINSTEENDLLRAITTFIYNTEKKYTVCRRNINLFKKKNKDWLSKPFFDDLPQLEERKKLKRKLIEEPPAKLVKAFTETVMSSSSRACQGMELIINTCIESPEKAIQISRDIKKSDGAQPYTPEEALSLIIDTKFSEATYKILRQDLMERGFAAYPPYYLIKEVKNKCYPKEEIQISVNEGSVSLQGLIDHTFERIIQIVDNKLTQYYDRQNLTQLGCILEASWRIDELTEQEEFYDNTIVVTSIVPLRMFHKSHTIWTNPCPKSYRSWRPLHMQYQTKTSELINSEKSYIENQIQNLSLSFAKTSKNQLITTSFTLIDDKDSTLPVEMLREQGAESMTFVQQYTLTVDRKTTLLDLFHQALETSDPVITNIHLTRLQ